MDCLKTVVAGDAKARAEDDLTSALNTLASAEEDGRRLEAEVACLAVERMTLLLEMEASKDEVASLHSQVGKDKEAIEKYYKKAVELIFAYGYGCYAFKHGICSAQPGIPDDMPDSADPLPPMFFVNLSCPPTPTVVEVKATEVDLDEATKDPKEDVVPEEQD